ncbi:hypothetical protein HHK36_019332 [Tetracentron sinense]|uniref:Diphosphomevalonate decarboxylase n=1 Tax=Tetracentron sinense TaxID=13715 RepID=A0A835D9Y6_TETSI|nr:hypothetical protein HHK36_019332 [Tetracentron sinense]
MYRQGSGSACRSLYGGFVKWFMGKDANGSDSVAVQLAHETHWDDLVILIPVVSSRQKETSSSTGMRESVATSTLLQHRSKEVVPKRMLQMEEAIQNRDFPTFARLTCAESNQFHAICLDTDPPIFYMNDTSHRQVCFKKHHPICLFINLWIWLIFLRFEVSNLIKQLCFRIINYIEKWNRFEGTPQVAYTCDAGPNVVLIAPNRKVATLLLQRLLFFFPPHPDTELDSYVHGDKSILQDAGFEAMEDVEALQPPPEIKDSIPSQKYEGYVSYFICTKPGRGPVLLADENLALLLLKTGMPK